MCVYDYISDNLIVDVSTDTEIDYYDEYTIIKVSVRLKNPRSGEWETVAEGSESLPTNR